MTFDTRHMNRTASSEKPLSEKTVIYRVIAINAVIFMLIVTHGVSPFVTLAGGLGIILFLSIGAYVVASGIYTVLGVQPPVFGSQNVVQLLADGLEGVVGAKFAVEPDPEQAAVLIRRHIEKQREGLGLPFIAADDIKSQAA